MPSTQVPPLKQELRHHQISIVRNLLKKVERPADLVLCCRRLPVGAVVGVDLAVYATEAQRTGAGVAVDTVGAVGPVLAGITLTLIYVLFASAAPKPGRTGAGIRVDAIMAQTTITTWI